eukprot:9182241-Heterocapsa_arctica.AAC.1
MLGYHVGIGGKWHGDYLVSHLQDFKSTNTGGSLRIFRVKEVVVDTTSLVQFPLSPVKDALERTLGSHGTTTTIKLVGIEEPVEMSNEDPSKCVYLEGEDVAEPDKEEA